MGFRVLCCAKQLREDRARLAAPQRHRHRRPQPQLPKRAAALLHQVLQLLLCRAVRAATAHLMAALYNTAAVLGRQLVQHSPEP